MKALLFVSLFALSGCLGNTWYVDSRFTAEEQEKIQAAVDSWVEVGATPVDLVFGEKISSGETGRRVVIRAGEREACSWHEGFIGSEWTAVNHAGFNFQRIVINVDRVEPALFQRVVAHEFGHYYIGSDHLGPGALMYRTADADYPTGEDVRALILSRHP